MKTHNNSFIHCTAGERRGLIVLSLLIVGGIGFRLLAFHNLRSEPLRLDEEKYVAYMTFAKRQQWLKDSLQAVWDKQRQSYDNKSNNHNFKFLQDTNKKKYANGNSFSYSKHVSKLDINTADSLDLESIPGIGAKTACQMIQYREKLGGYVSLDQLLEVSYMDSIRLSQLRSYLCLYDSTAIRRININRADLNELKQHPYIDYYLAKSIVVHRKANGGYRNLEEMRTATKLYPELFEKLKPYLCVE